MTLSRIALIIALAAAATVAGAWIFQMAGYAPCELCLQERIPYYVGAPLALIAFLLATRGASAPARVVLGLAGVTFLASTVLGAYHAGVEFGLWAGPADCTGGGFDAAATSQDFLKQLQSVQVVRCDAVAVRPLGLSLAAWNALLSAGLTSLAALGCVRLAGRHK